MFLMGFHSASVTGVAHLECRSVCLSPFPIFHQESVAFVYAHNAKIYLAQGIPTTFSLLGESCQVVSRRIHEIPAIGSLHPRRGHLKDSLGCGYLDMLMNIRGAKWEVARFSPIWVTHGFSMAQRVCWEEAPTQTVVFAGGNCEVGRLLISSCLGRSKMEFVRRLLRWRLGIVLFGFGPSFGFRIWVWTFLGGLYQWWCFGSAVVWIRISD